MEEELCRELPMAVEVFRTIRQRVYAVLFDLHKHLAEYRKNLRSASKKFAFFSIKRKEKNKIIFVQS